MFTHLQVHTHYSLLEAIGSPKAYVEQAKALGMESLACTDYGGMYGAIEFYQAAKKAGIKPLLWVELWYVTDMHRQDPQESAGMIVLLASTYQWYEQLMQLISLAHLEWFHKIPRIDHACLAHYSKDILAISWGERSWINSMIIHQEQHALLTDQREQLSDTLGRDACFLSRVAQEKPQWPLHTGNQMVAEFATKHHIPLVVTGDVHYIHNTDQHTFETALAIKDGKRVFDSDRRLAPREMHLQTEEEIRGRLASAWVWVEQITSLIATTQHIAESIDLSIPMDKLLFPIYESSADIKQKYESWQPSLISSY